MQALTVALCVTLAAAAPWPFSMWRTDSDSSDDLPPRSTELPKFYHVTKGFVGQLNHLAESCHGLSVTTHKDGNRAIQVVEYKPPQEHEVKYKTMVVAGEHARELIGPEIAFNFVRALCKKNMNRASKLYETAKQNTHFLIVVNANPGSRELVEQGDFCLRANPDHVDINRNFDIEWDKTDKDNAETNPGQHPFDQAESRILKNLMHNFKPHAYLDLHSGMRGMFFPNAIANDEQLSTKLRRLASPVDEVTCKCPLGVANKEVGYHTSGSALDYSFSVVKVPFAMAMEVYLDEDMAPDQVQELETRWTNEKDELLKPLMTGSSFLENGFKPGTIIPMSFIESGDSTQFEKLAPAQCLSYFNPVKEDKYNNTVNKWTEALAKLSIESRQVSIEETVEASKKPFNFHMVKSKNAFIEAPKRALQQKAGPNGWVKTPKETWGHFLPQAIMRYSMVLLGLLAMTYVGLKVHQVKTAKARKGETDPIVTQMAPVQISD